MVKRAAPITGAKPTLPRLQEVIQEYQLSNSVDGKSVKTVRWYTELLTLFLTYLAGIGQGFLQHEIGIRSHALKEFRLAIQRIGNNKRSTKGA
jgi:hypothetical protein